MPPFPPNESDFQSPPNENTFLPPEQEIVTATVVSEEPASPAPQGLSSGGIVAWVVVVLAVFALVSLVALQQLDQAAQVGGDATDADLMQIQIQTKLLVGQGNLDQLLPVPKEDKLEVQVPAEVDAGCYEQRLVYAVLKNEFEGTESAHVYLRELNERVGQLEQEEQASNVPEEERFKLTKDQQELRNAMGELLTEYEAGNFSDSAVSENSKELIKERLGFSGELFLLPPALTSKPCETVCSVGLPLRLAA